MPAAPAELTGEAKDAFDGFAKVLHSMGILTTGHGPALTMMSNAWAQYVEATRQVSQHGAIVKSPNGYPIQNPWLSIANTAHAQLAKLLGEFGLTPAAASKVHKLVEPEAIEAEFELR